MMTPRGAFAVKKADGSLYYGPKARFVKKGDSNRVPLTVNMADNVPLKIRPAKLGAPAGPREGKILRQMAKNANRPAVRKVRSNKGVKRGPRAMSEAKAFQMVFGSPAPAKAPAKRGRPAKAKPTNNNNGGNAFRKIFANRKPRSNKGVKRGPRLTTKNPYAALAKM